MNIYRTPYNKFTFEKYRDYKDLNKQFQEKCKYAAKKLKELDKIYPEYFYAPRVEYWTLIENNTIIGYCMSMYEDNICIKFPAELIISNSERYVDSYVKKELEKYNQAKLDAMSEQEKLKLQYEHYKERFKNEEEFENFLKLHKQFGNKTDTKFDYYD